MDVTNYIALIETAIGAFVMGLIVGVVALAKYIIGNLAKNQVLVMRNGKIEWKRFSVQRPQKPNASANISDTNIPPEPQIPIKPPINLPADKPKHKKKRR